MTPFERKRIAAGFTKIALAARLNLTEGAVRKWDNGDAFPSPKFVPRIAKLFKMTPDEVVAMFHGEPASATSRASMSPATAA